MRSIAVVLAVFLGLAVTSAMAGVAPSMGTSAAAQSGAKIAPPKKSADEENQNHDEHQAQPDTAK